MLTGPTIRSNSDRTGYVGRVKGEETEKGKKTFQMIKLKHDKPQSLSKTVVRTNTEIHIFLCSEVNIWMSQVYHCSSGTF